MFPDSCDYFSTELLINGWTAMNAGNGRDEPRVRRSWRIIQTHRESLHDPKKRHEMLSRKNNNTVNTFLGDGPGPLAGCSREKGGRKGYN